MAEKSFKLEKKYIQIKIQIKIKATFLATCLELFMMFVIRQ